MPYTLPRNVKNILKYTLIAAILLGLVVVVDLCPPPKRNYPVVNEISPNPESGFAKWFEIHNPSTEKRAKLKDLCLHISGSELYCFEDSEPAIPPGGFRVVCFSNDDNGSPILQCPPTPPQIETVATPLSIVQPWEPDGGQIALLDVNSSPNGDSRLVDFVAWGRPATEVPPGLTVSIDRLAARWVELSVNAGVYDPETELRVGDAISLRPGGHRGNHSDWRLTPPDLQTCGSENTGTGAGIISPPDGAEIKIDDATIVWWPVTGVEEYCVELKPDGITSAAGVIHRFTTSANFVVPSSSDLIGPGTYDYRVLNGPCDSTSSRAWSSNSPGLTLTAIDISDVEAVTISGIDYEYQRKDTRLLCLKPSQAAPFLYDGIGCDKTHWDKPHQALAHPEGGPYPDWGIHGNKHCVRASISMIVSAYAETRLSQDRIAYEYAKGTGLSPDYDLCHQSATHCSTDTGGACTGLLFWALGGGDYKKDLSLAEAATLGLEYKSAVTWNDIKKAINDQRPIMSRWKHKYEDHMRVIDGYYETPNETWIRVLDPFSGRPQWRKFGDDWAKNFSGLWLCPPTTADIEVQFDDPKIATDSDGDGIVDFDEEERFNTDPNSKDSDGDNVSDLDEIRSYVFFFPEDAAFPSHPEATAANFDGDEWRKELDPDNDDDDYTDGQEDSNRNGITEGSDESSCFDPDSTPSPRSSCCSGCKT